MALETLKELKSIDGYEVTRCVSNFSKDRPVFINDDTNQIAFQIQNGPIKEKGLNGCQVSTIISLAKVMLEGLNSKFSCRENSMAISKLDECLMWLEKRTKDRELRNVEGKSEL